MIKTSKAHVSSVITSSKLNKTIMKNLLNLNGVAKLSRESQKTITGGGRTPMDSCNDFCPGIVEANIFTGQCTCITED